MFAVINPAVDIGLISIGIAIISHIMQHRLMDRKAMKAKQKEAKEKQKQINKLLKNRDEKSMEKVKDMQKEMMQALNESMKESMKGMPKMMLYSALIFFPILGVLYFVYGRAAIAIPFPFTLIKDFWATFNPATPLTTMGWYWWYVVCVMLAGIIINSIVTRMEDWKENKERERIAAPSPESALAEETPVASAEETPAAEAGAEEIAQEGENA